MKKPAEKKSTDKTNEDLKKQNQEYLDRLQRLQAEFENYQKRIEKEKAEFKEYATAQLIRKFVDVIDAMERAIDSWKTDGLKDEHVKGLEMIYKNFYKSLEEEGLKAITTMNEQFDPYKHEVVGKQKSDQPENTIIKEVQKGYICKDRVLRHAKVIISTGA